MPKRKRSLRETLASYQPAKRPTWDQQLPADVRRELEEAKAAWKAGQLRVPVTAFYELARTELGIVVGLSTFKDWLRR